MLPTLTLKKCILKKGFVLFELSGSPVKPLPPQVLSGYTQPNNLVAKATFSPLHEASESFLHRSPCLTAVAV